MTERSGSPSPELGTLYNFLTIREHLYMGRTRTELEGAV